MIFLTKYPHLKFKMIVNKFSEPNNTPISVWYWRVGIFNHIEKLLGE